MERRLAAILAADVVGYTRLMGVEEAGTLGRLTELRQEILEPLIAEHRGRIVKLMGDGLLVEFASVVDAVACALAWQRRVAQHEADGNADTRLQFRIGVNLGDVIVEGGDIHGDGVNLASRLEGLAEPGGICLSAKVHEEVKNRLDLDYEDLGLREVKNVAEPVHAFRIVPALASASGTLSVGQKLALPDKPSIAVLPFENMSGDPEQEYFSDGITEDIITDLSRFRSLFVIARNSSFAFKGQAVDLGEIGRKLGVQYVVEGSVRKAGDRVRVTAQLVEAASGKHVWAERYDRDLEDIFAVQDEVVQAIAGTIPGHLERIAVEYARRKPPANMTAFDHLLRARWALNHSSEGVQGALEHLEQAIEADPNYASVHAFMSYAYSYGLYTLGLDPDVAIERACQHATRAVALDSSDPEVSAAAAIGYCLSGEHDLADAHSERAIKSNPNDPMVLDSRGIILTNLGRSSEAMECFEHMERIDPYAPDDIRFDGLCDCLFMLGEYEKLISIFRRWQDLPTHHLLVQAAVYGHLGSLDEAKASIEEFRRREGPKPDPKTFVKFHLRMMARQEDRDRWLDGYRKAGLSV